MRYRDRLGWMLSGMLIAVMVLFGCNVVDMSRATPTAALAGERQAPQDMAEHFDPETSEPQQNQPVAAPNAQAADQFSSVISAVFEKGNPSVVRISTGGGLGTGFVIDKQGHIVTNYHVVANSNGRVEVAFEDQEDYIGEVIGYDIDSDLAVVRVEDIDPAQLVPVEFGDSASLKVGQVVVAIGNPLGEERTATWGIISALRPAKSETGNPDDFLIPGIIQTDAAINPGNSGGPLFDTSGRVIGVNTFIANPGGVGGNIGIGYSVPINLVKKVAPALIEQGRYTHPYLGVSMSTISRLGAIQNQLPRKGVLIVNVAPGGPAANAGLREGDLVIAVDGTPVSTSEDVISYLEFNTEPGDIVTFEVYDLNGEQAEVNVEIGARPSR